MKFRAVLSSMFFLRFTFFLTAIVIVSAYVFYEEPYNKKAFGTFAHQDDLILQNRVSDWRLQTQDSVGYPIESSSWHGPTGVGQITGVAVDPSTGSPVIFHRGNRIWDYDTFDTNGEYQEEYRGPITENTVLVLNPVSGQVVRGWGSELFYLPHGIHIDHSGNVWLTDVALHQVFKFDNSGRVARLVLGQRFQPGKDLGHFCQPTSVAVAPTGEIVVADGYCNHRIVVFDSKGFPKYSIGEPWISVNVPHSLTILPNRDICIADRENSRVVCLNAGLPGARETSNLAYSIGHRQFGRVFGIASYGGVIYGINGVASQKIRARGFVMLPSSRSVVSFWKPQTGEFVQPHGIAVCPNGTALYVTEIGPNKVWKFHLSYSID